MCFLSCIAAVFVSGWYSSISRIMCLINAYRFFLYTAPHILGIQNREMELNITSACSFRALDRQLLNLPETPSPCITETVINTVYRKEGTKVLSHMQGLWRTKHGVSGSCFYLVILSASCLQQVLSTL